MTRAPELREEVEGGKRAVPEWIGATPDSVIPPRVKLRIFEQCEGRCAITGQKVRPGHFDYDHRIALCNGGENREGNLQLVSRDAHRAKTANDVDLRAKADRIKLKRLGLWKPKGRKLESRGFR